MLKNGNRAMILDITETVLYYDYAERVALECDRSVVENCIGLWNIEWPKENSYYYGIVSIVAMDAHARLLGDRKALNSVVASENFIESGELWFRHQEFRKKIKINRGDNVLKIMRYMYESLGNEIDESGADTIITRIPIEFNAWVDSWTGSRYISFYTRFSLLKDNKQIKLGSGENNG